MIGQKDIEKAYSNIKNDIHETPLVYSKQLSDLSGANVYLKMEQLQKTGSFKIRGVLNKLNSVNKIDFNKTFVAASTGNHAAAFAYASEKFGFNGVLFLPENVSIIKRKALDKFKIDKRLFGKNSMETECKATSFAKEVDGVLIHPYNDKQIIEGQGTIGLEILEQLPEVTKIITPIGGGGLISGICSYFSNNKNVEIIGCQPKNASEMHDSINLNKIVVPSTLTTIADAAAGGIEKDSITFDICKKQISNIEIIDEESIKKAVALMIKYHDIEIEPTAAIPVAVILNSKEFANENVVLVLTGKKIDKKILNEILSTYGESN
jgi:threonine dehydratase